MRGKASPLVQATFLGLIEGLDGAKSLDVEIVGQRAKRGDGDGQIWRGQFSIPASYSRMPGIGQTLHAHFGPDKRMIQLVVIEVVGTTVRFRAKGQMPV